MSEELGVRSEELVAMLRKCSASVKGTDCKGCQLCYESDCHERLLQAAADELERLNKERRPTPKITGRHMGTFIEASAIYMTKAGMEGCEYESMADIFDIYEFLCCAKNEDAKEEEA